MYNTQELNGTLPAGENRRTSVNLGNDEPQMEKVHEPYEEPKEWQPTKEELVRMNKEALREYEISIRFLNMGCIVRVGCKEIAFEDPTYAMAQINAYISNPWEEQKKWRKILD